MRTKAIQKLEERLGQIDEESDRGQVLRATKQFKTNWVELGQLLARVMEQGLFLEWGFASFDHYVKAELQLKRETALKLVRSFSLVREAKPELLQPERYDSLPSLDVVDFLSKKRDSEEAKPQEWQELTEQALGEAWSPRTVSQRWRDLIGDERKSEAPKDPGERAVRRARDLAERLNKSLAEIPGIEPHVMDAANAILSALGAL